MRTKKLFSTRKRIAAVALTGIALLGSAGLAAAYFTSTGTGTGSASVGTATAWTVTVSSDTTGTLLPGSGTETLNYTVTNVSTSNQYLSAVSAAVANSTSNAGCLGTWFVATPNKVTPADIAPGGTVSGTVTVSLTDVATSQNVCEGLTDIPVTVTAS